MKKQVLSLVTAVALCLGLVCTSALASTDGTEVERTEAVSVLSGLGIVDIGNYQPNAVLTRAQFCKLAVLAEGHGDQVKSAYRTLFSDVPATSEAAPFIHLAYEEGLISGYSNGSFGADAPVTVSQTVAAVLCLLGYSSDDIGPFWPEDYMTKASALGLLDDMTKTADQSLTQGDAVLLLYRLLHQTSKDGKDFIANLAAATEQSVVILDNDAEADDGTLHTAQVYSSSGQVAYYEQDMAISDGLVGRRGTLLLNTSGQICGFLPDSNTYKVLSLVSTAADRITDANDKFYLISSSTTVVADGEKQTYGNCWYDLDSRDVTLFYSDAGSIDLIVAADGEKYKGVTLTGYYENAVPNSTAPTTVTLLGIDLPVADGAVKSLSQFKVGERMTVVLNGAGAVTAAYSTSEKRADVYGVLGTTGTEKTQITLTNGLIAVGALTNGNTTASTLKGCLVRVNSSGVGKLTVSKPTGRSVSAPLNVQAKTLGSLPLAEDVKLYDRVGASLVAQVELEDILDAVVPASQIECVITNDAGAVSVLLLKDVTGNAYTYGVLHAGVQEGGEGNMTYTNNTVCVENSEGTTAALITGTRVTDGTLGGVAESGEGKIAGIVTLTTVRNVSRSDLSDLDGTSYVVLDGVRVPISDKVQVYNTSTQQWTTLSVAKSFTDSFTVYYSGKLGEDARVRVIYAN